MRILARQSLPVAGNDFHSEMCCSQRLYEYTLPLNVLVPPLGCTLGPTFEEIKNMIADCDRDKMIR